MTCFYVLLVSSNIQAQVDIEQHDVFFTIPEISIMDIEPDNTIIALTFDLPNEAGAPIGVSANSTDNTKWINYSSSISPTSSFKNISAQITSGLVPDGVELNLQAGIYGGSGQGVLGTPVGLITLNNTAQNIITGIGGAFTGDGINNGHQLTFSLSIDDYGLLDYDNSSTIEVTFTITD